MQYLIPNGTTQNINNINLFFTKRYNPLEFTLKNRYSKLGIQI